MRGTLSTLFFLTKHYGIFIMTKRKTLRMIMTGEDSENDRSEMVCGNSEFIYTKTE
jgi:hypothetical protein